MIFMCLGVLFWFCKALYFDFSDAVLVPTVNYCVCERVTVLRVSIQGQGQLNQPRNTGNVFVPIKPNIKFSFCY